MERQGDFFWKLLLLCSGVAATVSLLTTAAGLSHYLSVVLAWPLAAAVQGGLFGLAWLLASGSRRQRPLLLVLYLMTMPFSVVFSYVMLQGELTARSRPAEAQRQLVDELRHLQGNVAASLDRGRAEAADLELRLTGWLQAERQTGWAVSTCTGVGHCYLEDVCNRLRDRIASWEREQGRAYRQGPGTELIYGLLETERRAAEAARRRLDDAADQWRAGVGITAPGLDNLERLRRFDKALAGVPRRDLEAVSCAAVALPEAPEYEIHARDAAGELERPLYAFEDLLRALEPGAQAARSDYATLFAAALALFIDLFVLLVAVGASRIEEVAAGPTLDISAPDISSPSDAVQAM